MAPTIAKLFVTDVSESIRDRGRGFKLATLASRDGSFIHSLKVNLPADSSVRAGDEVSVALTIRNPEECWNAHRAAADLQNAARALSTAEHSGSGTLSSE